MVHMHLCLDWLGKILLDIEGIEKTLYLAGNNQDHTGDTFQWLENHFVLSIDQLGI